MVFTILTGENWDQTMFQFRHTHGYVSIIYFFSLVIIGVMIFLNLFLAILLDNFDDEEDEPGASKANEQVSAPAEEGVTVKIKNKCSLYMVKCRKCFG